MTKEEYKKIKKVAKDVRAWSERKAETHGFDPDLSGFCTIGTRFLFRALRKHNIPAQIALHDSDNDDCHAFALYKEWIIDITASQYGKRKVYIKELKKENNRHWVVNNTFDSERKFIKYLRETDWVEGQVSLTSKEERYPV